MSANRKLWVRVTTALLIGIPCVLCLVLGTYWLAAVAALFALFAGLEWRALTAPDGSPLDWGFALGCAGAPLAAALGGPAPALAVAAAGAAVGCIRRSPRAWGAFWSVAGMMAAGLAPAALVLLRQLPEDGLLVAVWVCAVVVATDTGAYFVGRAIGGRPLAPQISPGKTWAGALGGVGAAVAVGLLAAALTGRLEMLPAALLSATLSLTAQAGDLAMSAVKRRAGVKDTGRLLPGHGGVLDRIDSLIAASLVTYAASTVLADRGLS